MNRYSAVILATCCCFLPEIHGLSTAKQQCASRRALVSGWIGGAVVAVAATTLPQICHAVDVDDYLKSGRVAMPMGVSGQAGKSRPETGVVLRDGSDVSRDARTGDVVAEIVVKGSSDGAATAVLASYSSPWPLATGSVFDVECRDSKTGDGAFLSVTQSLGGKSMEQLQDSFLLDSLLKSNGRFSFYGPPTDVKVKSSVVTNDGYKMIDLSFSTISQATQTEIPRKARVAATVPAGTDQAVVLVASSSALRWKKGSERTIGATIDSFRAVAAPKSSLKIRGKPRQGEESF